MTVETELVRKFLEDHPEDAARLLEPLPAGEAAALLSTAGPEAGAEVLRRMTAAEAASRLQLLEADRARAILEALPLEAAVRLLRQLPESRREAAWEGVRGAESFRLMLRYPDGTAGSLMDPRAPALPEDITVEEAVRRVREWRELYFYYLYIVDRTHRLIGALDMKELLAAPGEAPLAEVMKRDVVSVYAYTDLRSLAEQPGWRELDALPVVEERDLFVGALRHKVLRRMGQAGGQDRRTGLNTLLALGEMYWMGMRGLLGGLSEAAASHAPEKEDRDGG